MGNKLFVHYVLVVIHLSLPRARLNQQNLHGACAVAFCMK
jgi:hypothetical protein